MKKFFRLVFSLLMIAFIVLSPSFIKDGIDKSVYTLRKEEKDSKYKEMLYDMQDSESSNSFLSNLFKQNTELPAERT